jgi:predicted nuclease of predicted toxin-antitoxin system
VRLLLDENCSGRRLLARLRAAGHTAETVLGALGSGTTDAAVLDYAARKKFAIITKDVDDFQSVAAGRKRHRGLLLINKETARPSLSYEAIVRAVSNVEAIYPRMEGLVISLNEFQW